MDEVVDFVVGDVEVFLEVVFEVFHFIFAGCLVAGPDFYFIEFFFDFDSDSIYGFHAGAIGAY